MSSDLDGDRVRLRVLGLVEIDVAGRRVPLRGHRERAIAATLALRLGETVSTRQLATVVWGPTPPPTATVQIQACVGGLRRRLADAGVTDPRSVLTTRGSGYALATATADTDLAEFRRLAHAAEQAAERQEHDEARDLYQQALDRWRGDACADVTSTELDATVERLTEERLDVLEQRTGIELVLDDATPLVAELSEVVASHPHRHRLRGHLMLALHRSGRQADALQAFRDAWQHGEPDRELQRLHQLVLADDPTIRGPQAEPPRPQPGLPAPRLLPAGIDTFVGRTRERAELLGRLTEPGTGTASTVVCLHGGGGVGKTTFAVDLAHRVEDAFPDGQLFAHLGGTSGPSASPDDVLASFLDAFGIKGGLLPDRLDERVALFRSCLAGRRVLVVLDDAADAAQVRPLLPGTPGSATIVTSRVLLTSLDAHHLGLGSVSTDEALTLLGMHVGAAQVGEHATAALRVVELCDRLPLAVRVAAARLTGTGGVPRLDRFADQLGEEHRRLDLLASPDLAVRATLLLSWQLLTGTAGSLLQRLALLPATEFPSWVAAALLDVDEDTGEDLLDELSAAHLVEHRGADRYQLHDLVRLVARERLEATEDAATGRAALRRVVDGWLGLAEAVGGQVRAGDAYTRGLARSGSAPARALSTAKADPVGWFGRWYEQLAATVEHALPVAPDSAATLAVRLNGYLSIRRHGALQTRMLQTASDDDRVDIGLRTRLLLQLYDSHIFADTPPEDTLDIAERALDAAQRTGDPYLKVRSREGYVSCLWELAECEKALQEADELLPLARAVDEDVYVQVLTLRGVLLADGGRPEEGAAEIRRALDLSAERSRAQAVRLIVYGRRLVWAGRYPEGETELRRGIDLADELGYRMLVGAGHLYLAEALARQQRWTEADDAFDQATNTYHGELIPTDAERVLVEVYRLLLMCLRGDPTSALTKLRQALATAERIRNPKIVNLARRTLAEAHARAGDTARAQTYLRQLPTLPADLPGRAATLDLGRDARR